MMCDVSNEPQQSNGPQQSGGPQWSSEARQPQHPGSAARDDSGQHGGHSGANQPVPDVVDAEVVEASAAPPTTSDSVAPPQRPAGADEEEFRQYQKFLEFQRFQEWQRKYGEDALPPPPGDAMPESVRRSWWKRALWRAGAKLVRRLIYLLVLLLVAALAFNWLMGALFGGGGTGNGGGGGSESGEPPPRPQLRQADPEQAIVAVYDYLATDDYSNLDPGRPPMVCLLFTPSAASAFASAHDAPDCGTAARRLHQQVTDPMTYKNPELGEDAVQEVHNPKFGGSDNAPNDAVVRSCRIGADGGPQLGDFGLRRESNGGWVIDSYERSSGCS